MGPVKLADNVWNLTPGPKNSLSASFLISGSTGAILFDTGFGEEFLPPFISKITDLPVTVINSHYHFDHIGCNKAFPEFYMHPFELDLLDPDLKSKGRPLYDGTKFNLGDREIEVVYLPGHSKGSVALFDRKNRQFFAGDTVSTRYIYMLKGDYSIQDFADSMDKILSLCDESATIFCCHGETAVDIGLVRKLKDIILRVNDGSMAPERIEKRGGRIDMITDLYLTEEDIGFSFPL